MTFTSLTCLEVVLDVVPLSVVSNSYAVAAEG